jgi:hypothetical protein
VPVRADPRRNPHRSGTAWTLRTVAAILANPRYTGRQVWNRQRTDRDLVDPANTGLGHAPVQRWNLPAGWVISHRPAHPALVSEADYVAAQDASAPRGPAGPAARRYLLAGLLVCGVCGRRLESARSNGKPAYRCRHGYTSATRPNPPSRPKNLYIREDTIMPRLAALAILQQGSHLPHGIMQGHAKHGPVQITAPARLRTRSSNSGPPASASSTTQPPRPCERMSSTPSPSASADTLHYDSKRKEGYHQAQHPPRPRPGPGDDPACPETAAYGELTCPRDLNPQTREISLVRGKSWN